MSRRAARPGLGAGDDGAAAGDGPLADVPLRISPAAAGPRAARRLHAAEGGERPVALSGPVHRSRRHRRHRERRGRSRGDPAGRAGGGLLDVGRRLLRHGDQVHGNLPRAALADARCGRAALRRADGCDRAGARPPLSPAGRGLRAVRGTGELRRRQHDAELRVHGRRRRAVWDRAAALRRSPRSAGRRGAAGRPAAHRAHDGAAGAADGGALCSVDAAGADRARRGAPGPAALDRAQRVFPARGRGRRLRLDTAGGPAARSLTRAFLQRGGARLRADRPCRRGGRGTLGAGAPRPGRGADRQLRRLHAHGADRAALRRLAGGRGGLSDSRGRGGGGLPAAAAGRARQRGRFAVPAVFRAVEHPRLGLVRRGLLGLALPGKPLGKARIPAAVPAGVSRRGAGARGSLLGAGGRAQRPDGAAESDRPAAAHASAPGS